MGIVQGIGAGGDGLARRRRARARTEDVVPQGGGVLVVEDGHPDEALGGVGHVGRLQLRGQLPLPLVPPVLEPDLHLGLGEVEGRREPRPLRAREVPLHVERRLQLEDLAPREHRPRLLFPLVQEAVLLVVARLLEVLLAVVGALVLDDRLLLLARPPAPAAPAQRVEVVPVHEDGSEASPGRTSSRVLLGRPRTPLFADGP